MIDHQQIREINNMFMSKDESDHKLALNILANTYSINELEEIAWMQEICFDGYMEIKNYFIRNNLKSINLCN